MDSRSRPVALVTGGGRGLGRAFALALAQAGMRVAVAARTLSQIEETAASIRASGGEALAAPADVTNEAAVAALVRSVEERLGPIDLLVNNAGAGKPFGPTWEQDAGEWWRTFETNVKGPLLCSNAVIPGMIRRGGGRILNVCSGAGTISIPYMSAYVTSKTALIRLTEVLADELREHGVRVFAIQPGTVRTALAEELMQSQEGERWLPWFKQIFDEGRDDSAEPGCALVAYLASGKADGLSGRFFSAPGDWEGVVERADEVKENGLRVLRLRLS